MVTYYTALGMMITKDEGRERIPIIRIEDAEYQMSVDELIIWGILHWNFLDEESIEKEYSRKKMKNKIFNDVSFRQTFERLITRGLVAKGSDYLAVDALYGLIGTLKIRPVHISFLNRIKSMTYFYLNSDATLKECYKMYFGAKITPDERNILKISKIVGISASEIIKCAENDIRNIKYEEDIMDKIYDNNDTYETIAVQSRFSELRSDVIKAVANLYLKKKIIFE